MSVCVFVLFFVCLLVVCFCPFLSFSFVHLFVILCPEETIKMIRLFKTLAGLNYLKLLDEVGHEFFLNLLVLLLLVLCDQDQPGVGMPVKH